MEGQRTGSYAAGFAKVASEVGIKPESLAKVAFEVPDINADLLHRVINAYTRMDPNVRRGINGGLIGGLGTMLLSDEPPDNRLWKAIAMGGIGGLGTYALSKYGLLDKGLEWLKQRQKELK